MVIYSAIQSNKGMSFENFIDATNRHYEIAGVAVIQKIPTPSKNVKGRIIYSAKSTVDFIGVAMGGAVAFEAKETTGAKRSDGTRRPESSFPLFSHNKPMISEHQIRFLNKWERNGGWAFVLVHFKVRGECYRVPVSFFKTKYAEAAKRNGPKSIPVDEFLDEWKVDKRDYLKILDE